MTKDRLRNYLAIKKEKDQLQQQLAALEAAMYTPKAQKLTGMPPSGPHGTSSYMTALVATRMELQACYNGKLEAMAAEQLAIEQAIDSLDGTARTLLRYRYLDGLTWEDVCVKMNYSWRQTHRLHNRALAQLKKMEDQHDGKI